MGARAGRLSGNPPSRDGGSRHQGILDGELRGNSRRRYRQGDRHRHVRAPWPGACELAIGSSRGAGREQRHRLVRYESPRGIADATLGALGDLLRGIDLIVLLGKALEFTTRWATGPAFDPGVRLIAIDPEAALIERAANEKGERLLLGCIADVRNAAETLIARAAMARTRQPDWLIETVPRSGSARYARSPGLTA
jgi:hypothetical protein